MARSRTLAPTLLLLVAFAEVPLAAQPTDPALRMDALRALKKAADFYHEKVASRGGYVYYYSVDLRRRWGEGEASPDTIFVQPPGTPTVGMAYLKAYAVTGERAFLDAAREAAEALVFGQLESGGWTQTIHFGQDGRKARYRNGKGGRRNVSSLDDGQTQAALQMLARADLALDFQHEGVHDAALYGLEALLKAQFPNGAFPQVWTGPVGARPVVRARFPGDDWKTGGRIKNYWDHYTLNDGLAGTVADTLITAHGVYKDERYKAALRKLGDFLILAQMPDPQPAWCQQYNEEMVPIWARKFEPPAVTGWESQDVMETLIKISRYTGDRKYLEPIPRALEYLRKCVLPDGKIPRYLEFKTNRPLYMDAQYRLTYDASAAPSHYGWTQPTRLERIAEAYRVARGGTDDAGAAPARSAPMSEGRVRGIISELDEERRWISTYAGERLVGQPKFAPSFRYISSEVFSHNLEALSEYVARPQDSERPAANPRPPRAR